MRGNTNFLSNGYAGQLVQEIFDNYSARVFISPYDILVLKRFVPNFANVSLVGQNKLRLKGPTVTISFEAELIEDKTRPQGSLRFEGKYPDYKLLFIENKLSSRRIETIALITERGEYIAI